MRPLLLSNCGKVQFNITFALEFEVCNNEGSLNDCLEIIKSLFLNPLFFLI